MYSTPLSVRMQLPSGRHSQSRHRNDSRRLLDTFRSPELSEWCFVTSSSDLGRHPGTAARSGRRAGTRPMAPTTTQRLEGHTAQPSAIFVRRCRSDMRCCYPFRAGARDAYPVRRTRARASCAQNWQLRRAAPRRHSRGIRLMPKNLAIPSAASRIAPVFRTDARARPVALIVVYSGSRPEPVSRIPDVEASRETLNDKCSERPRAGKLRKRRS
jgi:hypothetical protein